jgi:prepilin-type N-terminal cleavage/methylation domain-containing protein
MVARGDEHVNKNNRKGFTLAELLIVVAIIAVLVAISIPIFHAQLRKARLATNQANTKAAEEMAMTAYLTEGNDCTVYFCSSGTGKQGSYTPSAGTGFSYASKEYAFYVGNTQNISTPIEQWTVSSAMRPTGGNPFNAGGKVAKAWLVTVEYDKDKGSGEKGSGRSDYEFGIVALYDGEPIAGTGLRVGK